MYRTIKSVLFSLILLLTISSCEKEMSQENGIDLSGGSQSGTAIFVLDGTPSVCVSPLINGDYVVGTELDLNNSVLITANVTTVGTYTISTGLINGIRFSGSGTFAATGPQTITLFGSGTPVSAVTSIFIPGVNGCSFILTAVAGSVGPVTAVFAFAGAPADCTAPVIAGIYATGVPLDGSNTVTLTVDVTTAGTYALTTNNTNGITFSGSGTLAVGTGQTVVLTGSGTPSAANSSNFTVVGTNGCSFPITTITPVPAVFTLTGAPGACTASTVNGTYQTANPLTTSNSVTVEANVTTAGVYTISTNTVNGITFSKTAVFSGTGVQTIALAGSGTPVAVGTNTFTISGGGCTFDVSVTAPTSPCTGLTEGVFELAGQFTINGFSFGVPTGSGQYQISIQETFEQIDVFFPGDNPPAPGTYSIGPVTMHTLSISGPNPLDWNASSGSVYVSEIGGATVVEFCNVNFVGMSPLGGPSVNATGSGKMEP